MRIVLALVKDRAAYQLLLHEPENDVSVFLDVPTEDAEKLKLMLTDIDEDKYFIYYRKHKGEHQCE